MIKRILTIIGQLLLIFFAFFIAQIPTIAETFWRNESTSHYSLINHTLWFVISSMLVLGCVYLIYLKINGVRLSTPRITSKNLIIAVILAIVSQIIQFGISHLGKVNNHAANYEFTYVLHSKTPIIIILILTVIIITPILEELVFQGMIQASLFKNLHPIVNIILVASIFALMHGYSISWSSLELLATGLAFSITYYQTQDLKMAILCHGLSNLIALLTML